MSYSSLLVIIRFNDSLSDLSLNIPSPSTTTVLSLKQLIRAAVPSPTSTRRLRLIHAGKNLADTMTLSSVLRLPPPPPRRPSFGHDTRPGKGKEKAVEILRVVIHC